MTYKDFIKLEFEALSMIYRNYTREELLRIINYSDVAEKMRDYAKVNNYNVDIESLVLIIKENKKSTSNEKN